MGTPQDDNTTTNYLKLVVAVLSVCLYVRGAWARIGSGVYVCQSRDLEMLLQSRASFVGLGSRFHDPLWPKD
jgi:hypothetical protein